MNKRKIWGTSYTERDSLGVTGLIKGSQSLFSPLSEGSTCRPSSHKDSPFTRGISGPESGGLPCKQKPGSHLSADLWYELASMGARRSCCLVSASPAPWKWTGQGGAKLEVASLALPRGSWAWRVQQRDSAGPRLPAAGTVAPLHVSQSHPSLAGCSASPFPRSALCLNKKRNGEVANNGSKRKYATSAMDSSTKLATHTSDTQDVFT